MVVVRAGPPVTLRVAPASTSRLRLAFQPGLEGVPLARGSTVQTFIPCPSGATYYNGGLLVAGPQCAHLTVTVGDSRPIPIVAALGRRRCT
jgi:hypothetical protein